jgi:hypothetical protein
VILLTVRRFVSYTENSENVTKYTNELAKISEELEHIKSQVHSTHKPIHKPAGKPIQKSTVHIALLF